MTTKVTIMSLLCRLGVHRWHHYMHEVPYWQDGALDSIGFMTEPRRRCTKAGCTKDERTN